MVYLKKCPYCETQVQKYTYTSPVGVKQYVFMCDCTYGELRYNEDIAYEQYLHEREDNQITNFDKYFSALGTEEELNDRMDELCELLQGDCKQCVWGIIGQIVSDDKTTDCFSLWQWLVKTPKKD